MADEAPVIMHGSMNDAPRPPTARPTTLRDLRRALDGACSRDFGRLLGRWRGLSKRPDEKKLAALAADIEASAAKRRRLFDGGIRRHVFSTALRLNADRLKLRLARATVKISARGEPIGAGRQIEMLCRRILLCPAGHWSFLVARSLNGRR